MDFEAPTLRAFLEQADEAALDSLSFGVIGVDRADGRVVRYNAWESSAAQLDRDWVLGRDFFNEVGVCMNNFMIAQRFLDAPDLDEIIDYVLTFRMKPTRVRLRLLQSAGAPWSWIAVLRL